MPVELRAFGLLILPLLAWLALMAAPMLAGCLRAPGRAGGEWPAVAGLIGLMVGLWAGGCGLFLTARLAAGLLAG